MKSSGLQRACSAFAVLTLSRAALAEAPASTHTSLQLETYQGWALGSLQRTALDELRFHGFSLGVAAALQVHCGPEFLLGARLFADGAPLWPGYSGFAGGDAMFIWRKPMPQRFHLRTTVLLGPSWNLGARLPVAADISRRVETDVGGHSAVSFGFDRTTRYGGWFVDVKLDGQWLHRHEVQFSDTRTGEQTSAIEEINALRFYAAIGIWLAL